MSDDNELKAQLRRYIERGDLAGAMLGQQAASVSLCRECGGRRGDHLGPAFLRITAAHIEAGDHHKETP